MREVWRFISLGVALSFARCTCVQGYMSMIAEPEASVKTFYLEEEYDSHSSCWTVPLLHLFNSWSTVCGWKYVDSTAVAILVHYKYLSPRHPKCRTP